MIVSRTTVLIHGASETSTEHRGQRGCTRVPADAAGAVLEGVVLLRGSWWCSGSRRGRDGEAGPRPGDHVWRDRPGGGPLVAVPARETVDPVLSDRGCR